MKKTHAVLFLLILFSLPVYSQCDRIVFLYDNGGNRIKRELKTDCDDPENRSFNDSSESKSLAISLEPNPANRDFKISISEHIADGKSSVLGHGSPTEGTLFIIDINGKIMLEKKIYSAEETVDISSLSNGIYLCRIVFDDKEATKRFMVIK